MRVHTNDFKTNISQMGRQQDSIIMYEISGETIELGTEELNSITPHYKGDILKSVMKQLDIDSNVDIPVGTVVNCQYGIKVGDDYEYLDYGNYIVNKSEYQADVRSYKITCYDKMLLTMVDYVDLGLTYPITIRNYIGAICSHFGITFASSSDTFVNYDRPIPVETYLDENGNSLGYTFRDVLDDLAEVTASTICINDDDELEIRYITNTNDTIDEDYLSSIKVDFGEKYGPINSVVLSRSAGADNINEQDAESISENGLCELKIEDNLIMNGNDRDLYLAGIFNQLNGLEYYINDYSSTGIMYYELCDRYTVSINNINYSCVMLNDEVLITQGLKENIHTDMPVVSKTDYSATDNTDRRINQTTLIVNKQNQTIEGVVSSTEVLEGSLNALAETVTNNDIDINEKLEAYKQTVSTQFTQTNQDFTFQFDNIIDLINQVSDTEDGHYSELHQYIRFVTTTDGPTIILGQEGNQLTAELSNTKLSFKQNGTEVAYISNNKLYITNGEIITNLIIGDFQFIPKSNGSLSFKKVVE